MRKFSAWSLVLLSIYLFFTRDTSLGSLAILPTVLVAGLAFILFLPAAAPKRTRRVADIQRMHWREFEQYCGEVMLAAGYRVKDLGGGAPDGGVDLLLKKGGRSYLVQCKQWRGKVGVKVVRELYGVMVSEGASGGIICSGAAPFSKPARDFARGKPLRLLEAQDLAQLEADPHPPL